MQPVINWLKHNREWVFSGCGLLFFSGLTALFRWIMSRNSHLHTSNFRVEMSFGCIGYGPKLSEQMLFFTVTNAGKKPAQITGLKLPLSAGHNMFFPDLGGEKPIPCFIEGETSLRFWNELKEVQLALSAYGCSGKTVIRAVVTDGTGAEHQSSAVKILD
jgi:hypothetical protein